MSMGLSAGGAMVLGAVGGMALAGMNDSGPSMDPRIGQASVASAEVAADTLQWYKDKDAEMKPFRDEATQIALSQARAQSDTAAEQRARDTETYDYTKSTFRPLEQKIAADALGYDTAARRDAEAAQAQADIGSAGDAGRATLAREIQSRGGDVNSGNFTATLGNMAVREAAAKAGAGNLARKNVEAVGAAKLADAANLGRGIATSNATTTQLGIQAGNSATGNAQAPMNIDATRGSQMAQGAGTAISGNNSAGQLALGQYSAQMGSDNTTNQLLGTAATAVGSYYGMKASDKNIKTGRRKVSGKAALADVKRLPDTESWRYKQGSQADDGGQPHKGNMAQDVNRVMGEEVAPGGKVINMEKMSAVGLAAIKEVDKSVKRIESRVISLENARRKAA